jgi:hypothetical protein
VKCALEAPVALPQTPVSEKREKSFELAELAPAGSTQTALKKPASPIPLIPPLLAVPPELFALPELFPLPELPALPSPPELLEPAVPPSPAVLLVPPLPVVPPLLFLVLLPVEPPVLVEPPPVAVPMAQLPCAHRSPPGQ